MDPQLSGQNWSFCRDIETSVTIESLVFVAAFVVACTFFFVTTCSLSFFLDFVATDFDNVATENCCT